VRLVRFKPASGDDEIYHGRIEGETVVKIEGNIFSEYEFAEEEFDISGVEILPPVFPPNIVAIGLNYHDHAEETGHEPPEKPVIFMKATSSITANHSAIVLPRQHPDCVDYEAELGIVIGKKAKNVSVSRARDYILGYTCVNDVTARDCQENDVQWARAKSFDTFCPVGPWLETSLDPDNCRIKARVNGETRQDSNTDNMIFSVEEIVSYCSENMTLLPGTLILTGTPAGVGKGFNPPEYLQEGDKVEVEIAGIGSLENKVKAG